MDLKEYLKKHGIRHHYFARCVGISKPTLSRYCRGGKALPIIARRIEELTQGAIKAQDLINGKP